MCFCNKGQTSSTSCKKYKNQLKTLKSSLINIYRSEKDEEKKENDFAIIEVITSHITEPESCMSKEVLNEISNYIKKRAKQWEFQTY